MKTAAFIVALLVPAVALAPTLALAQGAPFTVGNGAVAIPPAEIAPVATAPAAPAPVVAPPADPLDPIGALIEKSGGAEIDEDTAEHIASPEKPRAPQVIAPNAGYTPSYARPNPSGLDRPVMLHETGVSPDGPPDISELTYESRVRGSIAAAQGLQGPLDGAWTLSAGGDKLYAFQMVDPGAGFGDLEGAWRDLKRGEAIGAVGVIDDVVRTADGGLTVRFAPRGPGEGVVVTLSPGAGGTWSGQLTDRGASVPVTLTRDGPSPTAGYAVLGQTGSYGSVRPYDPTPRAAPVRKAAPKATKGKKGKGKASTKKKAPAKKPAAKKKR